MKNENKIYPVLWVGIWKKLTKFMSIAIVISLSLIMIVRFIGSGFNHAETFKHISLPGFCLLMLGFCLFSSFAAFLIALWFKVAKITIADETLQGRSYWGRKKTIPLHDIHSMYPFSSNGITAIVVQTNSHGKVYISDQTERLEELLDFLYTYLPEKEGNGF